MTLLLNSAGLSEHRDLVRKCPFRGDLPIGKRKKILGGVIVLYVLGIDGRLSSSID